LIFLDTPSGHESKKLEQKIPRHFLSQQKCEITIDWKTQKADEIGKLWCNACYQLWWGNNYI